MSKSTAINEIKQNFSPKWKQISSSCSKTLHLFSKTNNIIDDKNTYIWDIETTSDSIPYACACINLNKFNSIIKKEINQDNISEKN